VLTHQAGLLSSCPDFLDAEHSPVTRDRARDDRCPRPFSLRAVDDNHGILPTNMVNIIPHQIAFEMNGKGAA
jgi:hypothetical protein